MHSRRLGGPCERKAWSPLSSLCIPEIGGVRTGPQGRRHFTSDSGAEPCGISQGVMQIVLVGNTLSGVHMPLLRDGKPHSVRVEMS